MSVRWVVHDLTSWLDLQHNCWLKNYPKILGKQQQSGSSQSEASHYIIGYIEQEKLTGRTDPVSGRTVIIHPKAYVSYPGSSGSGSSKWTTDVLINSPGVGRTRPCRLCPRDATVI